LLLGSVQKELGKTDAAMKSYKKAVELAPDSATARVYLGQLYKDLKMNEEAGEELEKALELDPALSTAGLALGHLYNIMKRYDAAINVLKTAVKQDPGNALARYQLGNAYSYKLEYNKAVAQYEQVVKLKPDFAVVYDALAKAHRNLGDMDKAIAYMEKYMELAPDDKDGAAELAKLRESKAGGAADPKVGGNDPQKDPTPPVEKPPVRPADGSAALMPVEYWDKHSDGRDITLWGYVDAGGNVVIKKLWGASHFSEGLADARPYIEGNFDNFRGYIDVAGNWITKAEFSETYPFHCGLAAVKPKGQYKWGYIDRSGNMVIPAQYEQADSFSCDIGRVNTGDGYRYIDKAGKFLFADTPFKGQGDTFSDGMACVTVQLPPEQQEEYRSYSKRVYIDTTGKMLIDKKFQYTGRFSEGLAFVIFNEGKTEKRGYMDKTGKLVIDLTGKIGYGRPFSDGMAGVSAVKDNEKWGYIDNTGKIVVEPTYHKYADNFHEGRAFVIEKRTDDFYIGYIDKTGKVVIPMVKGTAYVLGDLDWIFGIHSGSFRNGLGWYNMKVVDKAGNVVYQLKK
jgi:tetratricopeptide (TPR) repeat protein